MRPPRPGRQDAKGDWQRWAYDRLPALFPQPGTGVLTNLLRETHRRLLNQNARNARREEEPNDEPDAYSFGFGVNGWGPYATGTAVVGTDVGIPPAFPDRPELKQYFTYNGEAVDYPGVVFPPGVPLPGVFKFTSPYRQSSCRIIAFTFADWALPVPEILGPGESVSFYAPEALGFGSYRWTALKIE